MVAMREDKYSYSSGQCVVVVIEAIYPLQDGCREAEDILEHLQQYGYAEVISRKIIANGFDDACRILQNRARKANKAKP